MAWKPCSFQCQYGVTHNCNRLAEIRKCFVLAGKNITQRFVMEEESRHKKYMNVSLNNCVAHETFQDTENLHIYYFLSHFRSVPRITCLLIQHQHVGTPSIMWYATKRQSLSHFLKLPDGICKRSKSLFFDRLEFSSSIKLWAIGHPHRLLTVG